MNAKNGLMGSKKLNSSSVHYHSFILSTYITILEALTSQINVHSPPQPSHPCVKELSQETRLRSSSKFPIPPKWDPTAEILQFIIHSFVVSIACCLYFFHKIAINVSISKKNSLITLHIQLFLWQHRTVGTCGRREGDLKR